MTTKADELWETLIRQHAEALAANCEIVAIHIDKGKLNLLNRDLAKVQKTKKKEKLTTLFGVAVVEDDAVPAGLAFLLRRKVAACQGCDREHPQIDNCRIRMLNFAVYRQKCPREQELAK